MLADEALDAAEVQTADATPVDIVVIGAGQAGLSTAYFLTRFGVAPETGFVVLDRSFGPGGAWQDRWPSLTLSTVNGVHDLPGLAFADVVDTSAGEVPAASAVPQYYAAYEKEFDLPVHRPTTVRVVCDRGERLRVETESAVYAARGIINATGTWERPFVPWYPGAARFTGRQLHTKDYRTAEEFTGQHVLVVGGGISAVQLLDEISRITETTWVTRREPAWSEEPFTPSVATLPSRSSRIGYDADCHPDRSSPSPGSRSPRRCGPRANAARWSGPRCSPRSPRPASDGATAGHSTSTSSCGAPDSGVPSTISHRCRCATPVAASRWTAGSRPASRRIRASISSATARRRPRSERTAPVAPRA